MGIIPELLPCSLLEQRDLAKEETERVEPRKKDARDDLSHALFSEAEIVTTDNG